MCTSAAATRELAEDRRKINLGTSTCIFFASVLSFRRLLLLTHCRRLGIWFESEVSSEEVPQMPEVSHAVPRELSNAETAGEERVK